MKVLHISGAISWRGGEQQLVNLYHALANSGIDQAIYCSIFSALAEYCTNQKLPFFTFIKTSGFNILAAWRLKKMWRQNQKFDLLHLHDSDAHTLGYLAFLSGLIVPMVLSRKVVFPIKSAFFTRKKYNAACIAKIICVSEAVRQVVSGSVTDQSKLIVIYEGIQPPDEHKIISFELPEEIASKNFTFLAGYIAALTPEKDHDTFLHVAQMLIEKGIHIGFLLAGEGKSRSKIESRIRELGLQQHVFLLGFCKEIPALLKRLDVLLFTSTKEGFPITILEAFFMHLPVVTTAAGGIAEMVENEKTGLVSQPGASAALADNTARLLSDQALQERLTSNAYAFVQQFTYTRMAEKVLTVYKEVVQN